MSNVSELIGRRLPNRKSPHLVPLFDLDASGLLFVPDRKPEAFMELRLERLGINGLCSKRNDLQSFGSYISKTLWRLFPTHGFPSFSTWWRTSGKATMAAPGKHHFWSFKCRLLIQDPYQTIPAMRNNQHFGPIFPVYLQYQIPRVDLDMIFVDSGPYTSVTAGQTTKTCCTPFFQHKPHTISVLRVRSQFWESEAR